MSTILVTGGAGYIGSHTCKALAAQGYTPVVYDNLSEGHAEFVHWGPLVEGDLRDAACLAATFTRFRPAAVIHFAGSAYVGRSVQDPQHYYENNVAASLCLLEAMQSEGCNKLVFSSTCAVYGEPEQLPIKNSTPPAPINPYGRSKLMVEQAIKDCGMAHGLRSVALRYFNAAGADREGEVGERHIPETHLIPNVITAALTGDTVLEVYGADYPTEDGTCIRDYVHVSDLAAAHTLALEYLDDQPGNHVFNLGAGVGTSVKQVINEVEKQTGKTVPTQICSRRSGDPAILTADIKHSSEVLGWRPEHSTLQNIVETALRWTKKEKF
jgi:UDP-glucose-4-epimerase GalE